MFTLAQSRLQIPAITSSQFQSQDIITRHPCLPLGEFSSNATMKERNVMEVPPTASATPQWYFTLLLFLLPTQQICLFQWPSQKHSKPGPFPQAARLRLCSVSPWHRSLENRAGRGGCSTHRAAHHDSSDRLPTAKLCCVKSPVSGGVVAQEDTSKRFFCLT